MQMRVLLCVRVEVFVLIESCYYASQFSVVTLPLNSEFKFYFV